MLKDQRLQQIFKIVRASETKGICDVGTDHAYLPIELVETNKVPFAIATDISAPSLKKGENNILAHGLSQKIKTYCANGTLGVPLDDVGDVIIAGMGGELIASILISDVRLRSNDIHFVLQPMTKHTELRISLAENGFETEKEYCISDGDRIYFIMSVYYTGKIISLERKEKILGINTAGSALKSYAQKLYVQFKTQLNGIKQASSPDKDAISELEANLNTLSEYLNK